MRCRVAIAAVLAAAAAANAQPTPKNKERADAAFAEGQKKYAAGDYTAAAAKFETAFALDPDPAYMFNLAQAYRLGNACAKAAAVYRQFLAEVPDAPNAAKVKQLIEQSDECAKKQAPPPPPPPPVETPRPPPERIAARPPPPPPEPAPGPRGRGQRIAGLAIGGAGVIGVGIAAYFTYKASDYASQREGLCATEIADTGTCAWTDDREATANALDDQGDRAQRRARIAWGVGGAALIGGVVLVLLAPSGSSERAAMTFVPSQGGAMALGTLRW